MKHIPFFLFAVIIILISCNTKTTSTPDSNILKAKYLLEHSNQYISVKEGMIFRFREEYAKVREGEVKGVKIRPNVNGKFEWLNISTLAFVPKEPLDYGTDYQVIMELSELMEDEDHPGTPLVFHIKTRPLNFTMTLNGLKMQKIGDEDEISYLGTITSSDYVTVELVESLLHYEQSGNDLSCEWDHSNNGRRHDFVIKNINQLEADDSEIRLSWREKKWGGKFNGKESVPIPAKGKFELSDVRLSVSPERIINLYFSRPLSVEQNLKGLVTINAESDNHKTEIDGNMLYIYTSADLQEEFTLVVSDKIESIENKKLGEEQSHTLQFDYMKPAIRTLGAGMIMPNTSESFFPIEVVNLTDLDVEIFKIFENNVLQYLQDNNLGGDYNLNQVGKIVHTEKVKISDHTNNNDHNRWTRIGLNLKDYLDNDPQSIYQIRIGFRKQYGITNCEEKQENTVALKREGPESIITYTDDYYQNYENRNDPCQKTYYNPDKFIRQNVMSSDVGVIIKIGKGNHYHFAITSIATGKPIAGAKVLLYDYQQQMIVDGASNGNGFSSIKSDKVASFAVIEDKLGYAYIKLDDQNSNSLSDFNIGGVTANQGIDGFIYTDRGVHRPGDTVHLNFILDDNLQPLPDRHPVTLEVRDPKNNKKYETTNIDHVEKMYAFHIPIGSNSLTGQWRANIKVGANTFTKTLRIETIKPNRLKIDLEVPDELEYYKESERQIAVNSRWLHGASADGLKAKVEAQFKNYSPEFQDVKDYVFMDPSRKGSSGIVQILDKNLNNKGSTNINLKIDKESFPGKINADIKSRVFEKGGNFSENYSSMKISPFETYVGVKLPKNRWGYKSVKIGENGTFKIVTKDSKGKTTANRKLTVGIYNIHWRWWYYEGDRYNIYRLNSAEHKEAFYTKSIRTDASGEAELTVDFEDVESGRKMIRICDEISGHCTGDFFYARGWGASNQAEERESLAKLNFTSDKKEYKVDEDVIIKIPSEKGSRILMSIESTNDVLFQEWIEGESIETEYIFKTKRSMAPNVYAHAIMVQAYDDKENDLPIRMYGVVPILVKDPKSNLKPKIDMPENIEPKQNFVVNISEQNGNPMAYTIAIVDEGLLDLTNFRTPDPHKHFFAKQSLGVKTWDLYNHVMTGISGEVDRIISIGGDEDSEGPGGSKKAIRFKPVVLTAGPFLLNSGQSRSHDFIMPNYIGSVRAMIIARKDRSYGHSDETVAVKKDIMILPTMPRVLGPGELVNIPVSVFANAENIKNIKVSIKASTNLEIVSDLTQEVNFSKPGEKLVFFKAKVKEELGIAQVNVAARSGNIHVDQNIELDIRNPNPHESIVYDQVIEPGETWNTTLELAGMDGTNEGLVELSAVPPMNLEGRLDYLTRYPYGCVEQTVSAAFPQLSLEELMDVDINREKKIEKNVNAAIRRLSKLQKSGGGFAYWPGARDVSEWGTDYAGHFMIEAKNKGYYIPGNMLSSWSTYQISASRGFRVDRSKSRWYQQRQMINQGYRLFGLALYGTPELSAMNVLKRETDLPNLAQFMLSAAYAYAGKKEIALEMVRNTKTEVEPYAELSVTYGSDLRDMAMIAQALMKLERTKDAGLVIKKIAKELSSKRWYSTQTLSHSLLAVSDYIEEFERDNMNFTFDVAGSGSQNVEYKKPVYLYTFDPDTQNNPNATITNNSKDVLFARITMSGQKPPQEILERKPFNRNITLDVKYKDMNGAEIDPTVLERGTDFMAHIHIKNQNSRGKLLDEMALSQVFPSGWEIQSGGLSNISDAVKEDSYEYRDVRDDRVYTFFDLGTHKDYKIILTAAYDGEYFLPPVSCEAMYDNEIQAKSKGMKVKVVGPE